MSVAYLWEDGVWDRKDQRRSVAKPATFRVVSIGKIAGKRLDFEFPSDFGVFYDPEDVQILDCLARFAPEVDWEGLVYWRKHERGEIDILDPLTDEMVGQIVVRRRMGGDSSGEIDWTNVVQLVRRVK